MTNTKSGRCPSIRPNGGQCAFTVNHKQPHAILEYNGTLTHEWFTQQPTEVAASPLFVYVPMTTEQIAALKSVAWHLRLPLNQKGAISALYDAARAAQINRCSHKITVPHYEDGTTSRSLGEPKEPCAGNSVPNSVQCPMCMDGRVQHWTTSPTCAENDGRRFLLCNECGWESGNDGGDYDPEIKPTDQAAKDEDDMMPEAFDSSCDIEWHGHDDIYRCKTHERNLDDDACAGPLTIEKTENE